MLWGLKPSKIKVESSLPDETHFFHLPTILGGSSLGIAEVWLERAREAMERVKVKWSTFITDCSRHSIFKCQRWVLFNLVAGGEREAPLRLSEFCPSSARLWKSSLLETLRCRMVCCVFTFTFPLDNSFCRKQMSRKKWRDFKNAIF